MKKSDLKTGMRVVYANGDVGIVLADIDVIGLKGGGYCYISDLNEDLFHEDTSKEDGWYLVKVFEGYERSTFVLDFSELGRLIWQREQKTESQIQLEQVMTKLSELQANAAELQKEAQRLQEIVAKEG